ncbi:MAG: NAD-dependent epimerase/dehydratase family protein [Candidatus Micrarchaeia archaeon]
MQSNKPGIVFVTGGNGRLGSRLCTELVAKGYEVRALVASKERINTLPAGVIPFVGTLDDTGVLVEAAEGADIVVHTASVISTSKATASEMKHVNVDGTKNVVNACVSSGCKRLVFTSSIDVYGKKRKGVINERTQPKPTDKYGYSKLAAEREVVGSGLAYTILRLATIYGPSFEKSFFKVFKAISEGKIAIIGKGNNHLALVHVIDALRAVERAMQCEQCVGQTYNVSDGVAYTQEGLIDLAADMLHVARPARHVSEALVALLAKKRGLDSDELRFLTSDRVIDISKIRRDAGFEPSVEMTVGGGELVQMFLGSR